MAPYKSIPRTDKEKNSVKLCDHCGGDIPTGDGDSHADPQVCFETLQGFLDLSHKQADSTQGSLREVQRVLGLSEDSPVTEVVGKVKALRERVEALESALWRLRLTFKDHDAAICGLLKVKP